MDDLPLHSVSVSGIVINDAGDVLVIRRSDNGHWEPPGGILELGETFEEGVRREVYEETGVNVHVERLTGVYKNMERGVVALAFRCLPLNEPDLRTFEATEIHWLSISSIQEVMATAYAVRITDALKETVRTRAHNGTNLMP